MMAGVKARPVLICEHDLLCNSSKDRSLLPKYCVLSSSLLCILSLLLNSSFDQDLWGSEPETELEAQSAKPKDARILMWKGI